MADKERHLFEELLDFAVYVPVGLALRAIEEVPALAAEGRERIGQQVENARVLGRFSVAMAKRRSAARVADLFKPAQPDAAPFDIEEEERVEAPVGELFDQAEASSASGTIEPPAAIADYDALAASQVVPRLLGLSREELSTVGAYEAATRRRRTILGRVAQLLSEADSS